MAKRECKLRGMELLSIETLEEQNAILEQLSKNIKKQHFIQHLIFPLIGGIFVANFWTSGNAEGYSKYEFHFGTRPGACTGNIQTGQQVNLMENFPQKIV